MAELDLLLRRESADRRRVFVEPFFKRGSNGALELPRGDLGRGVLAVHRDARLRAERGVDVHELRARKRTLEGLEGDRERLEDAAAVQDVHAPPAEVSLHRGSMALFA